MNEKMNIIIRNLMKKLHVSHKEIDKQVIYKEQSKNNFGLFNIAVETGS